MGFGVGCATRKSKIAYNLEYLARTVKCLHSISINWDLLYFASNNPSNGLFLWTEVWQVFLLVYLPEGHKFPKNKNAGKTMNSTWFANSHAYVVYICTCFPF